MKGNGLISQLLIVMIAAIAVTIFAERRNIQAPILLALVGLIASFLPGLPRLELEPEIILTVVLPPLLFSAASEFSFESFIRRLGSIFNLGVLLVAVTTGVVGAVASAALPEMSLAAALVLGAVVSPPDAVSAVAVGRKLGLPGRMMTVLKGESLINDAVALTLFTFTTAAVAGTHLFINNLVLFLLYSAVGGVVVGVVLGVIVHRIRMRLQNASLATVLSVIVPFTAYIVAEELGASGVLAVVAAGFSLGHNASKVNYDVRIQERLFWRTLDSLLEAFVFAYIGLQMRFVLEQVHAKGYELGEIVLASVLVLVAVIVTRIGWVFATALLSRWRMRVHQQRLENPRPERPLRQGLSERAARRAERRGSFEVPAPFPWRENLVIGWTGMRGVVTLAAAAGIPLLTVTGEAFPQRDVIQAIAFIVTIGTLVIQGLTLPWLIRTLGISAPEEETSRERQVALAEETARQATIRAVTAYRDGQTDPRARHLAEGMLARVQASAGDTREASLDGSEPALMDLAKQIISARRDAVVAARDSRQIDDEVMREILEQMDLEEAVMANWTPGRRG
jgi:CPA1 family monovalent cation:H+ antiporter